MTRFSIAALFKDFLAKQAVTQTPTDILVALICQRIETEALSTDEQLYRGYYDSHAWVWKDKDLILQFGTVSYANNAPANHIENLHHAKIKIELEGHQQANLIAAINRANDYATKRKEVAAITSNEMRALDALEKVLGA